MIGRDRRSGRIVLGVIELDDLRVVPADFDARLRPVPQGLLRDPLVSSHRLEAGIPEDAVVFGFAPEAADPSRRARGLLSISDIAADTDRFTSSPNRWDPFRPLFVYDALANSAWVLWLRSSWRLPVDGPLSEALDAWLADPRLPRTLGVHEEEQRTRGLR